MGLNQTGVGLALLRLCALMILMTSLGLSAGASTVHEVRFAQTAKVLVWVDGVMIGAGREIALSAAPASAAPLIGAGELDPIAALEGDRLVVQIASNSGFVIETRDPEQASGLSVRVLDQGSNAQVRPQAISAASRQIFAQADRTAARPGTPQTQSLTLEILSNGHGLGDVIIRAVENSAKQ